MCEWDVIVAAGKEDTLTNLVDKLQTELARRELGREYDLAALEGGKAFFQFTGDEGVPGYALPSGYIVLHEQLVRMGYVLKRSSAVDSAAFFTK